MRSTSLFALAFAWLACSIAGCTGSEESPEQQIRTVLAAIETAAEVGDVSEIKDHISENYADARGNDKRALVRYIQFHLLRNERRHLLTREGSLALSGPAEALAVVHAGLLGQPAETPQDLLAMRADLYTFDLTLVLEDEDWRVVRAGWKRAAATDLF